MNQQFDRFWEAYPKKEHVEAARIAFYEQVARGADPEVIIMAVHFAVILQQDINGDDYSFKEKDAAASVKRCIEHMKKSVETLDDTEKKNFEREWKQFVAKRKARLA